MTAADWGGWRLESGALVHDDAPQPIAMNKFVTAADLVDVIAVLARTGESDEIIAGIARAYIALRRKESK
jgi:hypothetical protein